MKHSVTHPTHQLPAQKPHLPCTSRALTFFPSSGAASGGCGTGQDFKIPDVEFEGGFSQLAQGVLSITNTPCTTCEMSAHLEILKDMRKRQFQAHRAIFFSPCTDTLCLHPRERRFLCDGAPRSLSWEENQVSQRTSCSTEMCWDSLGSLSTDRGITQAQGARQPEGKTSPNHFSLESLRSQHRINWKIQTLPQMSVNTDQCPFLNPLSSSFL